MTIMSSLFGWLRKADADRHDRMTSDLHADGGGGRADDDGKGDLQQNMEKALRMKREAEPQAHVPEHQTPGEGMQPIENRDQAPSGAFDHAGNTPQLKRSHGVRRGDKG